MNIYETLNFPSFGNTENNILKNDFPTLKSPPELKQLTSKQIGDTYYGKPIAEENGYKIYSDEPIFEHQIEEVVIYRSRFSKKIGDIDVTLFAHRDGAFLLQRYLEALPQSNELMLFLEIDDEYNLRTVMRAVAGANLTKPDNEEFAEILTFSRQHEVTMEPKQLKELIENGIYKNKVSFVSWFLGLKDKTLAKIFDYFSHGILLNGAKFFKDIGGGIEGLKVSENGWNPNPKEGEYKPKLIPEALQKQMKSFYESNNNAHPFENLNGQKNINQKIVKALFAEINQTKNFFKGKLNGVSNVIPDFIEKRLRRMIDYLFGEIDKIEKYLADPLTGMQHLVYKSYQFSNAFLCGIYNSLVDVIAGIFSLIGFIFEAVAAMQNLKNDKVLYGEMFLELIEDLLEGIRKFDIADFFFQMIVFQMKTARRLIQWIEEKVPGFTLEQAAYYFGYILGIVVDIIVETLLTGGTAAVAKLAKTVESFMIAPLEKISQAITKSVNFGKDLLTRALEFLQLMLREFKKGVKNLFDHFNKVLDEVFGLGDEVGDAALTNGERGWKKKKDRIKKRLERKNKQISLLDRGKYLGQKLSLEDLFKIEDYLEKIKVDFQLGEAKGSFKVHGYFTKSGNPVMMEAHNAAMFITNGKNMKLILREDATVYEFLHELMHLRDCQNLGATAYIEKSLVAREKFVYDKMVEHSNFLNREELKHAEDYVNQKYYDFGETDNLGNPIKEILPFALKDIPKKRQGVGINRIINLK